MSQTKRKICPFDIDSILLAIVGSRTFNDYNMLCDFIEDNYDIEKITHIISGGAKGADSLGERFAKEHGKEIIIFKPDWEKYGKKAGFIRNEDIIKECNSCVAFWDGKSHGTKNDIELCQKNKKDYKICFF